MNDSQINESNPYNICSCEPEANCKECNEKEDLNCRVSFAKLLQFYCLFLPFAIPAIEGVIQSGYSSYLWGWLIMAIVFFGFWDISTYFYLYHFLDCFSSMEGCSNSSVQSVSIFLVFLTVYRPIRSIHT